MRRLLLLGPVANALPAGGLQIALCTIASQLEAHGWQVDCSAFQTSATSRSTADVRTPLNALQRIPALNRLREAIPASFRLTVSTLFWSRDDLQLALDNLAWIEQQLASPTRYDAVLVSPEFCPRGALALALSRHPHVAVISLEGLARELNPFLWSLASLKQAHPYFYRPARPDQIRCAIFASEHWRTLAIRAGLPDSVAHTIYFGIPMPPWVPTPPRTGRRLLWAARLAPEKGLHLLLAALPGLRQDFPDITLTVVSVPGEPAYAAQIQHQISALGLSDMVHFHPPVPRDQLATYYATHDLLFFYSMYAEPVALVLMEAFAHGIPVIANHANNSDLVDNSVTCTTYQPHNPASIASAIRHCLAQPALTHTIALSARALVERKYSLSAMGEAYHRLLSDL